MTSSEVQISALREHILQRMLRAGAAVALVPCVAGVWLAVQVGVWPVAILDTLGWGVLVGLAVHPNLSYGARGGGFLALLGGVGAMLLLILGPFGVGLIWLLAVPAVAGVLFGARVFWLVETAVMVVILLVAGGQLAGLLTWNDLPAPLSWWLMAAFSVLCVSLLVGLSTTRMMSGLTLAVRDVEDANRRLQQEMEVRRQAEAERAELREQVTFAQKMELVGQLAGGVAHDLNNLLTVVRVEGDLARDGASDGSDLAVGLDNLLEATGTAAALCQRLLLFARPTLGQRDQVELDQRIASVRPLLQSLAGGQVAVESDLGAPGARVVAEPVEIEQILTNLVANARDAMPEGGTVVVRTRLQVDRAGPQVVLEVEDDGTGMDESITRRVFEPFFTTKAGRGTGLGLATVYSLVRSMDGTVSVRSAPGRGSTFTTCLPVVVGASTGQIALPPTRFRLPAREVTVMVVEDNASVRDVVVRVLEAIGCVVIAEPDAARALQTLARQTTHLDLVVTDVLMPGVTGVDLAEHVQSESPRTAILAMTGWLGDGALADRLDALGVPILRKPFSPAELVDAVAEGLVSAVASESPRS